MGETNQDYEKEGENKHLWDDGRFNNWGLTWNTIVNKWQFSPSKEHTFKEMTNMRQN
jgi:hypothetical protein